MSRWPKFIAVLCIASLGACGEWRLAQEAKQAVRNYRLHEFIFTRFGLVHADARAGTACGTAFFKGDGVMNGATETEFVFIYDPRLQRELESTGRTTLFDHGALLDVRTPDYTERQKRSWRDRCPVGLREK